MTALVSCEKDASGISSLDGDYVLQKTEVTCLEGGRAFNVELSFENDAFHVKDSRSEGGSVPSIVGGEILYLMYKNYLFHDYEYIFDVDGSISVKEEYLDEQFKTGKYKVNNRLLYFSEFGFDIPVYTILSNKGGSLKLEAKPELLGLLSIGKNYEITKSIGYYKKK